MIVFQLELMKELISQMNNKLHLELRERVRFHSTASSLDGQTGRNMGMSYSEAIKDFYIIKLDHPTKTHEAVVITEACLERIRENEDY